MLIEGYLHILPHIRLYTIYFEECIFRQQVIILASFVKDDGTLFIILQDSWLFF